MFVFDPNDREADNDTPDSDDEEDAGGSDESASRGDDDDSDDSTDKSGQSEFFDPNKVPAPLKGAWRKMQAAFTRSQQGRSLERRKAAAFDKLSQHPEVKKIIFGRGEGEEEETPRGKGSSKNSDKDSNLIKEVGRVVDERLKPLEQRERKKEVDEQFKQFKKRYPDYKVYKDEMAQLMERFPEASFEELYIISKHNVEKLEKGDGEEEDLTEDEQEENEAEERGYKKAMSRLKKKTSVNKPGGKSISEKGEESPKTIAQAYQKAKKDLLKK